MTSQHLEVVFKPRQIWVDNKLELTSRCKVNSITNHIKTWDINKTSINSNSINNQDFNSKWELNNGECNKIKWVIWFQWLTNLDSQCMINLDNLFINNQAWEDFHSNNNLLVDIIKPRP